VAQDMKFRPETLIRTLDRYRELIEQHPAQLTLLPETALPLFFAELPPAYVAALRAAAERHGGDLILGALSGDGVHYWNSAISLGGSPLQIYRKTHLVPFGEMIPPGFAWFMQLTSIPLSSFARGPERQAPLAVAGRRVAINICYEDAFGEEIIAAAPAAGIFANLSNTAWFGHSLAQPQHLQIARARAMETGRPMLRSTNTGMTALVLPDGSVPAVLPAFTRGVLEVEVPAFKGLTPYARWGDVPALIVALIGMMVGIGAGRWGKRSTL